MRRTWLLSAALALPFSANAEAPSFAARSATAVLTQRISDDAATRVAAMLDSLRQSLAELESVRRLPHAPAASCLEPIEGMRAKVRDAQEAHLDLEAALATADLARANAALSRVERAEHRSSELGSRLHACVERAEREAPIVPWSQQSTTMVAPLTSAEAELMPSWPPAPPRHGPDAAAGY